MAADDGAIGFDHFRKATGEYLLENFEITIGRETNVSQGGDGTSAHGIHVAQGVGSGDLAEGVRVVDDGGEEVHGLHQRGAGVDLINTSVVGVIEAYEDIWILLPGKLAWKTLSSTAGLILEAQPPALTVSVRRVLSAGMGTL